MALVWNYISLEVFPPYENHQPVHLSAGKINLNSEKIISHACGNNV